MRSAQRLGAVLLALLTCASLLQLTGVVTGGGGGETAAAGSDALVVQLRGAAAWPGSERGQQRQPPPPPPPGARDGGRFWSPSAGSVLSVLLPYAAQFWGWVGTALGLAMTNMADKSRMMLVGVACSVCQISHFALLDEPTAARGQVVLLLMCGVAHQGAQGRAWARGAYWALYPVVLLSARGVPWGWDVQWLPVLGSLLSVVARHQGSLYRLRLLMVFANLPWLPYCVATRDASNLVGMALFTGLSLLAFVRFHVLGGKGSS